MRHLKTYTLFERSKLYKDDIQEHIKILKDICLELSDKYYFVDIQEIKGTGILNPDSIRVFIFDEPNGSDRYMDEYKPFTYDDVKVVFERMIDYMDSQDFEVFSIGYSIPEDPASHNNLELINGKLLTYSGKEIDNFHHLSIKFTEKEEVK